MLSLIYVVQCIQKKDLIYIGRTNQTLQERKKQHEEAARKGSNTKFHQALINYGFLNWEWRTLDTCPTEDEIKREKELILKYAAAPIELLNTTHGQKERPTRTLYSNQIIDKVRSNKSIQTERSELGRLFLRQSGKLKPVINLKSKKVFESAIQASKLENLSLSTIRLCCSSGKMVNNDVRYAYLDLEDKPILTQGHEKEHFVGKRTDSRKVKNLINGKVYKDINEVAKEYEISKSSAEGAAKGTYMTIKNKWVFCYIDNTGKEIITENHRRGLDKINAVGKVRFVAWYVDDIEMSELFYFRTLDEICEKLHIKSKSHITSVCKGRRSHAEKWRFAYFDSIIQKPILYEKHGSKARKIIRKVICLNDKKIFENGTEAGIFYNLNPSSITNCAQGNAKSIYKDDVRLRFAFLDDNNNPILKDKHLESLSAKGKARIQLLKDGTTFNSLAEYLRTTGVPYKTAKRYMSDKSVNLLGFEFIVLD